MVESSEQSREVGKTLYGPHMDGNAISGNVIPSEAAPGTVGEERSWLVQWDLEGQGNDR